MCGIFGYHGKLPLSAERKPAILKSIAHRGPDDSDSFEEANLYFAHSRLSILDTSSNGHQPMFSADENYVIIYNGELYNHSEIRKRLIAKGYSFRSHSDTETLLYAFIEYKEEVLQQLNGIFAFAVCDRRAQKLFVARDHLGVKPLYYYHQNGAFCFGSELKSICKIEGLDAELNTTAFVYYLQMLYAPGDITPFKHILKLEPGHYMEYDLQNQELKIVPYYRINFQVHNGFNEKEWIEEIDIALGRAVKRQLQSDVPVGFFLSGGLDSSLVASYASMFKEDQSFTAFTISSNQAFYNEGFEEDEYYAKLLAKHLGIKIENVDADFSIVNEFDTMIYHLDEPQADPAPLLVYNISKKAREAGIKVLLSGAGADDIFSGYRRHQALNYEKFFNALPGSVYNKLNGSAKIIGGQSPFARRFKKLIVAGSESRYERWANYFAWLPETDTAELLQPHVAAQLYASVSPQKYWINLFKSLPAKTASLNKMLYAEMKTFLPDHNLNYIDKMSMAQGVEARVPFLDTELLNMVNSMPVHYKMKGGQTKYILRELGKKYLPEAILKRRKTGFGAPVRQWIKEDMREMVHERLQSKALENIFDKKAVAKLVESNESGKVDAAYSIWALLSIESWLRQFKTDSTLSDVKQKAPVL